MKELMLFISVPQEMELWIPTCLFTSLQHESPRGGAGWQNWWEHIGATAKLGNHLLGKLRQMPHNSAGKSQSNGAGGKGITQKERQCSVECVPTVLVFRGSRTTKDPQTETHDFFKTIASLVPDSIRSQLWACYFMNFFWFMESITLPFNVLSERSILNWLLSRFSQHETIYIQDI